MQQRKWKQKLSGLMAGVMLLGTLPTSAFAWDAPTDVSWDAATETVAARFFVGSDTHIGRDANATKKLENALNVFYELDPVVDGVLLAGDVTNNGYESEYTTLMNTINASELKDKVVLAMGNHEYNAGTMARFEEKTGQAASEVLYYNADGLISEDEEIGDDLVATVIKLSAKNYGGDYTDNYEMMKIALETSEEANNKAPIIVIGHHGIKNTAYVTEEWNGNYGKGTEKDMIALMEEYPQVIHFSGHSHATLEDARSIYQDDGYTAIQDGTIGAYFENESGKVSPTSGSAATRPDDSEISSQAMRVDVMDDGTVKIYRMNLTTGEYMYEPWVFNAAEENMPYTSDRENDSEAPSFDENAAVTVDSITKNSAVVKFPAAEAASDGNLDMIHEYVITLTPDNGGSSIVRKVFADYYEADQKTEWSVNLINLDPETTYSVSVTAVTSFDAESAPITSEETFTTGAAYVAPYPAEAILNVDFSRNDSGIDAGGHTQAVYGEPQFIQDETLGRTVAVFDGENDGLRYAMTTEDYEKINKNFTVELYYMPLDTKNNNPMGNTQSSGFCFEQKSGTNTLQFWAHIDGYKKPETNVAKDAWNHMVATFDGQNVKLYKDGELMSTVAASGTMTEPPHYLFLGGDTSSSGTLEYQANCKIALARVYTGTMTADDVKAAYEAATADRRPGESDIEYPWTDKTDAKIAVISDDHLYDTDVLGTTGEAFQKYLNGDRKMLVESEKILDAALAQIAESGAEYLLISGDLTKDGEKVNHELLAEKLTAFETETGIEVFVINGNHDISNAHAVSFTDNGTYPADTVDTEMFKEIYADFGYDHAIAQDTNSLSYAADLGDDYRLIVMDACIYNNDAAAPQQQTGGKFSDETLAWVLNQIEAARREGRTPIGMMHHGLVPHTAIQPTFFSEYLVDDYANVSKTLADAGMSLVFTGHFHSQDAAYITTEAGNVLHDVETGSLVTDPSPIRYVALDGSKASYVSAPILNVDGLTKEDLSAPELAGNGTLNFSDYSHKYLLSGLEGQVPMMLTAVLMQQGYDQQTAYQTAQEAANSKPFESAGYNGTLAQFMAACMAYHYTGDEDADTSDTHTLLSNLAASLAQNENALYQLLGTAASALIHDTQTPGDTSKPLADNAAEITLTEGEDLPTLPIEQTLGMENGSASLKLAQIGRYISGETNKDGGVMEIVAYNPANQCAYAVNGQSGVLAAIPLNSLKAGQTTVTVLEAQTIDAETLVNVDGFSYGDMTSVSVSPDGKTLAVAIQADDYTENGRVALFNCNTDGSLTFVDAIETGIQPDMVTFTPDGSKILTANEGEPRLGYTNAAAEDPAGSVTVIDVKNETAQTIGFTAYDSAEARQALVDAGIVLKKDTAPSVDLEPEYIACSNTTAYISLQEANAIAVLDLKTNSYKGIYSVGFEDYSKIAVDINGNGDGYSPETYENLLGIRMPDGISMVTIGGVDYILTANEGDSRAWPVEDTELNGDVIEAESDVNEVKDKESPTGNLKIDKKVTWFDASQYDGLKDGVDYLFGGRSFTMFQVTDSGLVEVFDSKNDFESKTAAYLPDYFNCSNDDVEMDSRSGKKGPEPETVVTGVVDGRTYAFVTLERIGGVMVYDITDPAKVSYVNYINSRDFENVDEDGVGADDSPEGLAFVPASQSPTGSALLLAACEVGGTVAVYDLTPVKSDSGDDNNGGSSGGSSSSGSSVSGYPITVENPDHGTVTTSPKRADKGDTVTITVKPDAGYELDELIVTDKNGDSVKVTDKGNGKYTFTMPNGKVNVEAAFAKIEQSAANPFVDVNEGNYFYDAVQWAVKQGITSGTSATTFAPNVTCTRAQMATFLWRAAGSPAPKSAVMPFRDVPSGAYYYTAVQWAVEQGITSGTSATTFSPNAVVTRAQTVTFLWRFAGSPAAASGNSFADVAANAYYADAVQWAAKEGITSGTSATTFGPDAGCTRAQIVTFLWRYMAE